MKNIFSEKNEVLMESINLPRNYGETRASESMQPLNDAICDIIHKTIDIDEIKYNPFENVSFDEPELNPDFIEEVSNTEKQESILVKDLDDLFR